MANILIAFVIVSAAAIWLFGWGGAAFVVLFSVIACCQPRRKSGPFLSFIEKLGVNEKK